MKPTDQEKPLRPTTELIFNQVYLQTAHTSQLIAKGVSRAAMEQIKKALEGKIVSLSLLLHLSVDGDAYQLLILAALPRPAAC